MEGTDNGFVALAPGDVPARTRWPRRLLRVSDRVREHIGGGDDLPDCGRRGFHFRLFAYGNDPTGMVLGAAPIRKRITNNVAFADFRSCPQRNSRFPARWVPRLDYGWPLSAAPAAEMV